MTPTQDDILDELYFVTSFLDLKNALGLSEETLGQELKKLLALEFVKSFFPDPDSEVVFTPEAFDREYNRYFYLATKKGLLAHNSR